MYLAESGLIGKVLIKGRGKEMFSKFCPPPPCENFLRFPSAFLFIDGQFKQLPTVYTTSAAAIFSHQAKIGLILSSL